MKKVLILFACLLAAVVSSSQNRTPQERYIDKYSSIAVEEMLRTGIPASITLAQGILESGAGLSPLATDGNNHFGIKCHNGWTGRTVRADDDRKNECFRAYDSAAESFRDHSDFLRYRDRYKFLFEFDITDYKSWAYGLKQAGYATDPAYASKLIRYIEDYNLSRFDAVTLVEGESIPDPPLRIEEPVAAPAGSPVAEQYRFSLSRQLYSRNGVPFIYAVEGESYRSIAKTYHLFLREILKYNDLSAEEDLLPGTVVYLQAKKKEAQKGLEKYIVGEDGETLRGICQRFAVQERSVRKLNGLGDGYVPREGDELKLRK